MSNRCIVPLCESRKNGWYASNGISFHELPSDLNLRRKWVEAIGKAEEDDTWIFADRSFVCSLHFPSTAYKSHITSRRALIPNSLPSIFPEASLKLSDDENEDKKIGKYPVVLKGVKNKLKTNIPKVVASDNEKKVANNLLVPITNHVNFSVNSVCSVSSASFSLNKARLKKSVTYQTAEQTIKRLKAKVCKLKTESELLRKENLSLSDKLMGYSIDSIQNASEEKDPKVVFLKDQLHSLRYKKMNWSVTSLQYAAELYNKSPSTYEFLRNKVLNLPSQSTVSRCLRTTRIEDGSRGSIKSTKHFIAVTK